MHDRQRPYRVSVIWPNQPLSEYLPISSSYCCNTRLSRILSARNRCRVFFHCRELISRQLNMTERNVLVFPCANARGAWKPPKEFSRNKICSTVTLSLPILHVSITHFFSQKPLQLLLPQPRVNVSLARLHDRALFSTRHTPQDVRNRVASLFSRTVEF